MYKVAIVWSKGKVSITDFFVQSYYFMWTTNTCKPLLNRFIGTSFSIIVWCSSRLPKKRIIAFEIPWFISINNPLYISCKSILRFHHMKISMFIYPSFIIYHRKWSLLHLHRRFLRLSLLNECTVIFLIVFLQLSCFFVL